MKKFFSLLIILTSLLSLFSCGEDYAPQKSTEEEAATVMTISIDGEKYEIKYELYRALFLNLRESVDGGDSSVWYGDKKAEYVEKIDSIINSRVAEIYAVFHHAKKIGINPFGSDYDKEVKEYVKVSVDGGYYNGTEIEGFGKDYGKYLEYLNSINLNYSVQDLMLRYSMATEDIFEYYAGNLGSEEYLDQVIVGKLQYTEEDVRSFYYGDECVRVIRAFLPEAYFSPERANEIRDDILEKSNLGETAVVNYINGKVLQGASDEIIANHNLDRQYYGELIDAAFSTPMFDVSCVIHTVTGYEDGYNIIYRAAKTNEHFSECYDSIAAVYVENEIGKIIDTVSSQMQNGLKYTSLLSELDRAGISMSK